MQFRLNGAQGVAVRLEVGGGGTALDLAELVQFSGPAYVVIPPSSKTVSDCTWTGIAPNPDIQLELRWRVCDPGRPSGPYASTVTVSDGATGALLPGVGNGDPVHITDLLGVDDFPGWGNERQPISVW